MIRILLVLGFIVGGLAMAQGDAPPLSLDLVSKSFGDFVTAMALIGSIVAFSRQHIPFVKALANVAIVAFSAALGLLIFGLGGFFVPITVAPFAAWGVVGQFVYGLAVALSASGFYDLIKSILGVVSGNAKPSGTTQTDANRARLR